MRRSFLRRVYVLIALALLALAPAARAEFLTFSDRALFQAAAGGGLATLLSLPAG